jgi:hypothetical protein
MSHQDFSGDYTYNFVRLDPEWNNSLKTGISSLVIGLTCTYSGTDSCGCECIESQYVDGSTGFSPFITADYLSGNIEEISNSYASGNNWWYSLKSSVSGKIDHPVVDTNFPFPESGNPVPHPPED